MFKKITNIIKTKSVLKLQNYFISWRLITIMKLNNNMLLFNNKRQSEF